MGSRAAKRVLIVLAVVACAMLLLVPTGAGAQGSQEGPQFRNWGPGMSPPDQEGVDPALPASGAAGGPSESAAAAPYGGYAAPGAVAPIAPYSGCQYDLRGTWWNDGRQTAPSYRTYSAYVFVRQYRSWIHAQQDDGTSYYGQCLGTRLLFDVYNAYQYVGRQSGTISGYYRPVPWPMHLYDDPAPAYSMPAITVPASSPLRASFTWTSFYGSGAETWALSYGGIPAVLPPVVVPPPAVPTATPVRPTPTPAPPNPTPAAQTVRIDALQPPSGPYGMEVVVTGSGFAPDNNLITFGPSSGLFRPDGSPANLIARVGSTDGRTVRFVVPRNGPSGQLCDASGSCISVNAAQLQPGTYDVGVSNGWGTSNLATFEITPEG